MSTYDLIVRRGTLVLAGGPEEVDLAVADGRIAAIASGLEGTAREEIDALGLHVFPGAIDAHAHFNEPGRTHWEGFETGSRALVRRASLDLEEDLIFGRYSRCEGLLLLALDSEHRPPKS
jgi:predicted amidohydrolase YtcJ